MREEEREEEGVAGKEERRRTCWRVEHVKRNEPNEDGFCLCLEV